MNIDILKNGVQNVFILYMNININTKVKTINTQLSPFS